MKEYLKIAWRNLWRNKKRTLITVASIFFAIFLALIMRSMQLGSYEMMVNNSVKTSTGYIQIHKKGYWDDKTINNTFELTDTLDEKISLTENISLAIPRIESFALASFEKVTEEDTTNKTKGAAVIGTRLETEDKLIDLKGKVTEGEFFTGPDDGVLIAEGLADYLKIGVNDSLVLLGQGYHGVTASGLFPVRGIIEMLTPEMNNTLIYMSLERAQELYGAYGRATSYSFMLEDPDRIEITREKLAEISPGNLEVMTWDHMLTELVQQIESDNISGLFMLGILYLVVGFGILGTVIMMTMERKREFGIMVAVGMRKYKLNIILFIETVVITVLGILSGALASIPVIIYFRENPIKLTGEAAEAMLEFNIEPILPFLLEPGFYFNQGITVLIIALVAFVYPLKTISGMKVVNAIKGK